MAKRPELRRQICRVRGREATVLDAALHRADEHLKRVRAGGSVGRVERLLHEHHPVEVGVAERVVVVGAAELREVGDRIVCLAHLCEVLCEARKALPTDGASQLGHPPEVGVDRHRRGAHRVRDPPQGQPRSPLGRDQLRRRLDQRRAQVAAF